MDQIKQEFNKLQCKIQKNKFIIELQQTLDNQIVDYVNKLSYKL